MIYFLSDAHIGSRALEDWRQHQEDFAAKLLSLKQDATAIYLLGDIFDFWFEYFWRKPEGYETTLNALKTLTESGIEVHFFIGNHDIWTFGWLEKQTGVKVHKEPLSTTINGKKCFLAHGDGIVPSYIMSIYPKNIQRKIRNFILLRKIFHNRFLQWSFRCFMPPAWGDKFGYNWAKHSRDKELAHPVGYKGENQEELVLFAKEKEQSTHYDYYIFGHRHIELDLCLATNSRVIILGDMFKQWTYAQMDDNGNITLQNFE